jgi:hypothetical protein
MIQQFGVSILDHGAVALCGLLRGAEELLDHTQRQVTFADLMCTL